MRRNFFVQSVTASVFGLIGLLTVSAAQAQEFDQAASYNVGMGMAPGEENMGANGSTRDANGNRVFINGVGQGMAYPVTDMASQFSGGSPNGTTSGVGAGSATAVGNALNVTVNGSWNTVIVNSKQINNGNQTATLNGNLHF